MKVKEHCKLNTHKPTGQHYSKSAIRKVHESQRTLQA